MKPAPVAYRAATSVAEAVTLLSQHDDAKLLAGGQTLVPLLNLRLTDVGLLVDIGGVPGLSFVRDEPGGLRVGALTRHAQLEGHTGDLGGLGVLRRAAGLIGHYPIRTRGTIGGSLAHADPTAEWCLLALLLDAELIAQGPNGRRAISAAGFFQGLWTTALAADEMLVEVRFPWRPQHADLREFARRQGDFAIVAAGVAYDLQEGRIARPRVVVGGAGPRCQRLPDVEAALAGQAPTPAVFDEAAALACRVVEPAADAHGDVDYRRWLTERLIVRASHAPDARGRT